MMMQQEHCKKKLLRIRVLITKDIRIIFNKLAKLWIRSNTRNRQNNRVGDKNVRLMVVNGFLGGQSFKSTRENCRKLDIIFKDCAIC